MRFKGWLLDLPRAESAARPDRARPSGRRTAPFQCVAFSVTSRKRRRFWHRETWQVDAKSINWDDIFAVPQEQDSYDEAEFRSLAALNGWRLILVVPARDKARRLYFRRSFNPHRAPYN
jgi:hypothetical protein